MPDAVTVLPTTDGIRSAGSDYHSIQIVRRGLGGVCEPSSIGIPFPAGQMTDPSVLKLVGPNGDRVPLQTEILARWADGSVKWLLLDWVPPISPVGESRWSLVASKQSQAPVATPTLCVRNCTTGVLIETGSACFRLDRMVPGIVEAKVGDRDVLAGAPAGFRFRGLRGKPVQVVAEQFDVESMGPARATVKWEGRISGRRSCRFIARACFFAGTGLVRVRFTLHNPRPARHKGGLWDLGDPSSVLFRELSFDLPLGQLDTSYILGPDEAPESGGDELEIYQGSSGGENWQSRNHLDRSGRTVVSFRGCRLRRCGRETFVYRPSPVVVARTTQASVVAAIPEFWQQFPKCLEARDGVLRIGLFPMQWGTEFELLGGEQKTHALWLNFGTCDVATASSLNWVHAPARLEVPCEWLAGSGALPSWAFPPAEKPLLRQLLAEAIGGADSLIARREVIDEYGWRNFGDLYADHEAAFYTGTKPVISHYNNQYDVIWGTLLQWFRTGDTRWLDIAAPLARHVIDIDIYHTRRDKAAYNGGLFWHTDHYRDAGTAAHRAYSIANARPGLSYGGGPCNEQNYTTGLLHYYYLTGDPLAREAVLSLAEWVIAMDDGGRNILGLIDNGPTGQASSTTVPHYHGPGRGCGNSVNALLDGWLLTDDPRFLAKAEALIRRSIHPEDDVAARDLLNAELRWSYTVFLGVLARYLDLKAQAGQYDDAYSYAQSSLVHYAEWMVANERFFFDFPDQLEYPTETWSAQEIRKSNALRAAAAHADELIAARFLARADEISERVWSDLGQFERPGTTRALAILLVEGLKDSCPRAKWFSAPRQTRGDWPSQTPFVPQKMRVARRLKSASGLAGACLRLLDPRRWRNVLPVRFN
jgi:hypothetical protein